MSIYICTICNQQKDSDFNCAELDGKERCEECFETMEEQMSEVIISKEPLKKVAMVDIKPRWIASFFYAENIAKAYGSLESFMFNETMGYKRQIEPDEQLFMYNKQDL